MSQSDDTTIIRGAFAAEAILNIVGATSLILSPNSMLNLLAINPADAHPTTLSTLQWFGAITFGLSVPLFAGLPERKGIAEFRRATYLTLGACEAFMVPVFLWQASKSSGVGLTSTSLTVGASILGSLTVWRAFVLYVRPEMLGSEKVRQKRR